MRSADPRGSAPKCGAASASPWKRTSSLTPGARLSLLARSSSAKRITVLHAEIAPGTPARSWREHIMIKTNDLSPSLLTPQGFFPTVEKPFFAYRRATSVGPSDSRERAREAPGTAIAMHIPLGDPNPAATSGGLGSCQNGSMRRKLCLGAAHGRKENVARQSHVEGATPHEGFGWWRFRTEHAPPSGDRAPVPNITLPSAREGCTRRMEGCRRLPGSAALRIGCEGLGAKPCAAREAVGDSGNEGRTKLRT